MDLPKTETPEKYNGLFVIDFGDHSAMGYTADEVALLLESEEFAHVKVYKIHRAKPDGQMDLAGITNERFHLESGMFFHYYDETTSSLDWEKLTSFYEQASPPCRAKLQLTKMNESKYIIALIYPAEQDQEIGQWLSDSDVTGYGPVDAGTSQVDNFYNINKDVLKTVQLWPEESLKTRDFETLKKAVNFELQR